MSLFIALLLFGYIDDSPLSEVPLIDPPFIELCIKFYRS